MSRFVGRGRKNQRGAIAVMVAMMVVLLLVLSGFTVDFGQAYVAKRKMQTAADAAALAAASAYTSTPGNCTVLSSNGTLKSAAQALANSYRSENQSSDTSSISVGCDSTSSKLLVTVSAQTSTPSVFGRLAGGSGTITVSRDATASVDVSPEGQGLRPMALCLSQLPNPVVSATSPAPIIKISYPKVASVGAPGCPDTTPSGNWWTVDCPELDNASATALDQKIQYGCTEPVDVATPQDTTSESTLSSSLISDCSGGRSSSCLSGNPGNNQNINWYDAWKAVVDAGKTVIMPVFCAPRPSTIPTAPSPARFCNPTTVTAPGTGTIYPVYSLVGARVCGYHWKNNPVAAYYRTTTGDCAGTPDVSVNDPDNGQYLYLVFKSVQTSGGTGESQCKLGDEGCDGGVRRVLLAE